MKTMPAAFITALRSFLSAGRTLELAFEALNAEQHINATHLYPFAKSFDEVMMDLAVYRHSFTPEPAPEFGGYVEDIVDDPQDYDGLEIHGVRDLMPEEGHNDGTMCEPVTGTDHQPQFFSVYAHLNVGGVECIGDFKTAADARAYAAEVSQRFSATSAPETPEPWPIYDHTEPEKPSGTDLTKCVSCGTTYEERELLEPHLEKLENGDALPVGSCPVCLGPCYPVAPSTAEALAAVLKAIEPYTQDDEAGRPWLTEAKNALAAPAPYVLVTISGGVAEVALNKGFVEIDVLDYDNLKDLLNLGTEGQGLILTPGELAYIRANDDPLFVARVEAAMQPPDKERAGSERAAELMNAMREAQTAMWERAGELEELLGVEIDTRRDFSTLTTDDL